jgi:spore maturation protein CgeB
VRVLVVDTYYPAFLASHYRDRSGLAKLPYAEQLESLMGRMFGTADAYSRHLRELGHEAEDVVVNCPELQLAWARERGRSRLARAFARIAGGQAPLAAPGRQALFKAVALAQLKAFRPLLERVLAAQIEEFDPDVVYVQDLNVLGERDIARLRSEGRFLVAQVGSLPPEGAVGRYDFLTTSFPHYVDRLRKTGLDAEYLAIAFDERVIERLRARGVSTDPGADRPHAAVFAGTVHAPRVHRHGTSQLERLAREPGVELYGQIGAELDPESPILRGHGGEAWGLDMYELLARSRVAINRHGDVAEGHANNMRLFEATGVGATLVTERAKNLGELFAPDREVVAYDGTDDLLARIRGLLADDDERIAIARAGQERTLRDHTYRRRIEELAGMLEARL